MPIYEFHCQSCGSFEVRRPIAEASAPATCPDCQQPASRIFTSPNVGLVSNFERLARTREEKSRHEPSVVSAKKPGSSLPHKHSPSRPWQIGH
jgi:putative FmdB family regulatory protein